MREGVCVCDGVWGMFVECMCGGWGCICVYGCVRGIYVRGYSGMLCV